MASSLDFRTVFMPYVVERQADGRYRVLNGELMPLGQWSKDQPVNVTPVEFKGLTAAVAATASFKGDPDLAKIFLYDKEKASSSVADMASYLKRLGRLMKLKVIS